MWLISGDLDKELSGNFTPGKMGCKDREKKIKNQA
jgi:hypothetical protein